MVRDHHDVADAIVEIHAASGVRDDQCFDAEKRQDADGNRELRIRIPS